MSARLYGEGGPKNSHNKLRNTHILLSVILPKISMFFNDKDNIVSSIGDVHVWDYSFSTYTELPYPAGNYMFKFNNRNTRTRC